MVAKEEAWRQSWSVPRERILSENEFVGFYNTKRSSRTTKSINEVR